MMLDQVLAAAKRGDITHFELKFKNGQRLEINIGTINLSIIDLEASARMRSDRTSNIHIRKGHYLIVKFYPNDGNHATLNPAFTYHWGHVKLSRDGAIMLMSEVDKYVV